jgi:hypothetical protein
LIVHGLASGSPRPAGELLAARDRLQDARDELEAAKEARETITAALKQAEKSREWSGYSCKTALSKLLATVVPPLLAEVRDIQATVERKKSVLAFLSSNGAVLPDRDQNTSWHHYMMGCQVLPNHEKNDLVMQWQAAV